MEVTLRKMGNSTALVMPPPLLRDLGLSAGRTMKIHVTENGKIVLEPRRKYKLADLIAQCDLNAAAPADLRVWDKTAPVGGEVW
jgi:antitoxin ChpS